MLFLKTFKDAKFVVNGIVRFLRLLAACWPGAQSARDSHVLVRNFAKYSPILRIFFTRRLSNKPVLIWLLKTLPHLKLIYSSTTL